MPKDIAVISGTRKGPQDNIPRTKSERNRIKESTRRYVDRQKLVAPLSIDELKTHSDEILRAEQLDLKYRDFTAIILSNSVWRDSVAGIPYDKRLLLLPKCLRNQDKCPGHFDELGLVCEHCGSCVIDEFKAQAERLGYAVLIAEGSPVVMALIETGKIEAVVGVSCTSVLERVFPYMEAGAVPGIAIPLLYDGCVNTHVDVDWVWEAIYQSTDTRDGRLNLDDLRNSVEEWFTRESLESLLASDKGQTEELAFEWMAKAGKRWRPFLAACAYQALNPNKSDALLDTIRRASVAIECFHKASLIHDDIEDNDTTRYEAKTLHTEYGVPVALNIGDFLLGEGYRLLAELKVPDALRVAVVQTAAEGHRTLCLGQGAELSWTRRPGPLSVAEVINIYRKKTSPAFEVALKIGAILGKGGDELTQSLERYSWALGIAYQIRDDVEDFYAKGTFKVPGEIRPSLLLAQAYEMAYGEDKTLLESIWNTSVPLHSIADKLEKVFEKLGIEQLALDLMESYKYRAINSLALIKNAGLKGLLRRVAGKIFNEFEVMGCCNDHKAGHGRSRESSD